MVGLARGISGEGRFQCETVARAVGDDRRVERAMGVPTVMVGETAVMVGRGVVMVEGNRVMVVLGMVMVEKSPVMVGETPVMVGDPRAGRRMEGVVPSRSEAWQCYATRRHARARRG